APRHTVGACTTRRSPGARGGRSERVRGCRVDDHHHRLGDLRGRSGGGVRAALSPRTLHPALRSGAPVATPDPVGAATQRANILLVRADDAVRDAADELDFAVAQFGTERTRALAATLEQARGRVMQAF